MTRAKITVTVNGREYEGDVEARLLLSDFIREHLGLTGTHVGCEHGVCGACTIIFNGATARSCLLLAVQAHGAEITTIEGIAEDGTLHPVQQAFRDQHGLQCGYCTPGFVVVLYDLLEQNPSRTEAEIKEAIGGNVCRCTGYENILRSARAAMALMAERAPSRPPRSPSNRASERAPWRRP